MMFAFICFTVFILTTVLHHAEGVGTIIPLYVYPTSTSWKPLIDAYKPWASKLEAWVIVNPHNGPGDVNDSKAYAKGIQELHDAGFKLMGYVHTSYLKRDINEVLSDIDRWADKELYQHITGIFVDEMVSVYSTEADSYYSEVNDYIVANAFEFNVGNPGVGIDIDLIDIFDSIVIYEQRKFPGKEELDKRTFSTKVPKVPAQKFAIMSYQVSNLDSSMSQALDKVGFIFMQTRSDEPWNYLPSKSFLEKQFKFYVTGEISTSR